MVTPKDFNANFKVTYSNISSRVIESIMQSENPTTHPSYEQVVDSAARAMYILSGCTPNNWEISSQDKKEAKQIVALLKDNNFDFTPVRNELLKDVIKAQDSVQYWDKLKAKKDSKYSKKSHTNQQNTFYNCYVTANNALNVNENYSKILSLVDDISRTNKTIEQRDLEELRTNSHSYCWQAKKEALETINKYKMSKIGKIVKKANITQSQLENLFNSRSESTVLEYAAILGEKGEEISEAKEQEILNAEHAKYAVILSKLKSLRAKDIVSEL